MQRWILATLVFLFLVPAPVLAQDGEQITVEEAEITIQVDKADTPLAITGWLGEENAFVGNLRLSAQGSDIPSFTFLASDLSREEGDEVVGRQHVTLIGDPTLSVGVPKNFQVSVTGLELPGTYQGQIELLLPGQARTEAVSILLTVVAKARPNLTPLPGTEQVRLRLVRCGWAIDCALAQLLLPDSAFLDEWLLQFDNRVPAPVTVLGSEVVVLGEHTGYQLTDAELSLPLGAQTLAAGQIVKLPLSLNRSTIPPDHYAGSIYLTLEGQEERLTVPLDLSMRTGPWWPVIALLLGIILGRVFKYMQERGGPQAEALEAVNQVQARFKDADPDDQEILAPMIADVRRLVYREKLETVTATLKAIEARLEALRELRAIEEALQDKKDHPSVKEILDKIAQARQDLALKQDTEAQKLVDEIKVTLTKLKSTMMGPSGQPDRAVVSAAVRAEAVGVAVADAALASSIPAEPNWLARLKEWLVVLSGLSTQIRAETTLWLVRPLLYLALMIGLLAVGIGSLYVDKGATFGANPFADFLALVLWGLSADVASRSLSNLQGDAAG